MTCKRCMDTPCDIVRATRKLLGTWARERRRQDVGLLDALADQPAMDEAIGTSVDETFRAECSCQCHERK